MSSLRERLNEGVNFDSSPDLLTVPSVLNEDKEESAFTGTSLRQRLNGGSSETEEDNRVDTSIPDRGNASSILRGNASSILTPVAYTPREDDPAFTEYYVKRMIPVPDTITQSQEADTEERMSRYEKSKENWAQFDNLNDSDYAEIGTIIADGIEKDLKNTRGFSINDPLSHGMKALARDSVWGAKTILGIGEALDKAMSGSLDGIEEGLQYLKSGELGRVGSAFYTAIDATMAGGRYARLDDPRKLANRIGENFGAFTEFLETLPAYSSLMSGINKARKIPKYNRKLKNPSRILDS